jgi:hypothetical protein
VVGTRGKTAQPVMINCTEGRPAVSQQNFLYYTHIKVSSYHCNSIFKATRPVTGASTKQMGCQSQLFRGVGIHNGCLNKVCFKDTDRYTDRVNAYSYPFMEKNEPTELDFTICSHHL